MNCSKFNVELRELKLPHFDVAVLHVNPNTTGSPLGKVLSSFFVRGFSRAVFNIDHYLVNSWRPENSWLHHVSFVE